MPCRRHDGRAALPLRHALALGVLHGPAELLPVSSSGHTTLIPWLARWPYGDLDPEYRKAFEIALHAGTAAGLLLALRREVGDAARGLDRRRAVLLAGSFLPPAIAGWTLERPIERHLGTPPTIAVGLLAGSAAMALADGAPQERDRDSAGAVDAFLLGLAQACALAPGVSRNGATLVAARLLRFRREDANALSRHVALPIIVGATALKGTRVARRGLPPGLRAPFFAGALAAFGSTFLSTRLIGLVERDRSLAPYAAYRAVLATAVLVRACRWGSRRPVAPLASLE